MHRKHICLLQISPPSLGVSGIGSPKFAGLQSRLGTPRQSYRLPREIVQLLDYLYVFMSRGSLYRVDVYRLYHYINVGCLQAGQDLKMAVFKSPNLALLYSSIAEQ